MIQEILAAINQLLAMDSVRDAEKDAFIAKNSDPAVRQLSGKLSTRDVLIVATVAAAAPYPQKQLVNSIPASQPTISRAVERLSRLGLINRTRIPHNDKEWQLKVTNLGRSIASGKRELDRRLVAQTEQIASHYTTAELTRFNELLHEIIALKE